MNSKDLNSLKSELRVTFPSDGRMEPPTTWTCDGEELEDTQLLWGKTWKQLAVDDFHNDMYCFFRIPPVYIPFFWGAALYVSIVEGRYFNDALGLVVEGDEASGKITKANSFLLRCIMPHLSDDQKRISSCYFELTKDLVGAEWTDAYQTTSTLMRG